VAKHQHFCDLSLVHKPHPHWGKLTPSKDSSDFLYSHPVFLVGADFFHFPPKSDVSDVRFQIERLPQTSDLRSDVCAHRSVFLELCCLSTLSRCRALEHRSVFLEHVWFEIWRVRPASCGNVRSEISRLPEGQVRFEIGHWRHWSTIPRIGEVWFQKEWGERGGGRVDLQSGNCGPTPVGRSCIQG